MSTLQRILTAKRFALACHGNQMYGDFPYEYHLEKVQDVYRRRVTDEMVAFYGLTREILVIALWLHDTIEDTPATRAMIEALFGTVVASIVFAVSDAKIEGANRKLRHWGTDAVPGPYRLIPITPGATLVKLCDRIANMEASVVASEKFTKGGHKLDMYKKEQTEFYQTLYVPHTPLESLWVHLNNLLDYIPGKE